MSAGSGDATRSGSTSPTRPRHCSSGRSCAGSTTLASRRGHGARLRANAGPARAYPDPAHRDRSPRRTRLAGKATGLVRRSLALTRFGRATRHSAGREPRLERPGRRSPGPAAPQHGAPRLRGRDRDAPHQLPARRQGDGPEVIPFEALAPPRALDRDAIDPIPDQGAGDPGRLRARRPAVLDQLRRRRDRPIAVLRPPATMSLYHRGIENTLFDEVLEYLLREHGPRWCCCHGRPNRRPSFAVRHEASSCPPSRSMARRWSTRRTWW